MQTAFEAKKIRLKKKTLITADPCKQKKNGKFVIHVTAEIHA